MYTKIKDKSTIIFVLLIFDFFYQIFIFYNIMNASILNNMLANFIERMMSIGLYKK